MVSREKLTALSAAFLVCASLADAQQINPHQIYEEKCAACHEPHGGDFVWGALREIEGNLIGLRSGKTVDSFLSRGHGQITQIEAETLLAHFVDIRASGQVFARKCRVCHESARELARLKLIEKDSCLTGRYSGRDIRTFLLGHGRLTEDEVEIVVDMLNRNLLIEEQCR